MGTAKVARVGNSAAAILPSAVRREAGIEVGDTYELHVPRPGTVVLRFASKEPSTRIERFEQAQARIHERSEAAKPWNDDFDAEELIRKGKEARARAIIRD